MVDRQAGSIYVELHCHSNFSFHDGASHVHELLTRATDLGYHALALTDHDNLCGAMEFAQLARSLGIQPITGAEVTLKDGYHITLLAKDRQGYGNLCQLLSASRLTTDRRQPELDPKLIEEHSEGLILLTGCRQGEVSSLVSEGKCDRAAATLYRYLDLFGRDNVYVELQQNLVLGDTARVKGLVSLANQMELDTVATNNVHYHVQGRHRLQDTLVAIKYRKTLDECHVQRRANGHFYLKPPQAVSTLFQERPEAISKTLEIAERLSNFDLTKGLGYRFPKSQVPEGHSQLSYLRQLSEHAALRRYGSLTQDVQVRLDEEINLIERHDLAGFFLIYRDIVALAWEVMVDLGRTDREIPVEENPPGRGRGSSVSMLVGYLLGLSHIDPLKYKLSLERFLPDDEMGSVPDIDLDFPRDIREELIKRVHQKYGPDHAALTGMISTYKLKGAVRDLGLALGLPSEGINRLLKRTDGNSARYLGDQIKVLPEFKDLCEAPAWHHMIDLAPELEGFPKYLAQHPGGMVIGSSPLTEIVPIQPGAINDRYVMQWDKNSIDDAGFVKIDFLALGTLSQMQDAQEMIEQKTGHRLDYSRIDFEDKEVYDMICNADTVGIFQVESAAQMQTVIRIKPRNLVDMAHEVAAVRPGVGVTDGVTEYIARRNLRKPVTYDHPLAIRALERTLGVILFQDQVNQLAIDVGGFSPLEADQLRRAFGRRNAAPLVATYWEKFRHGAARKGVNDDAARRIFHKFNGQYMFPESHAFAFGVTAYQSAWLKRYYPQEFYAGLFNQQPMGFYDPETLKEDARRHGIAVLNPDINLSRAKSVLEGEAIRLGFRQVKSLGEVAVMAIEEAQDTGGRFPSIQDFMTRTGLLKKPLEALTRAGAFDALSPNRRQVLWEIGLRYVPINNQLAMALPVDGDMVSLEDDSRQERMQNEYRTMGLYPYGHVMSFLRERLGPEVVTSQKLSGYKEGDHVTVAGRVIRRQRPKGNVVFITLEDEFGHSPLIIWPKVYTHYRDVLKESLVVAKGVISRRDKTLNVVVSHVWPLPGFYDRSESKDWG